MSGRDDRDRARDRSTNEQKRRLEKLQNDILRLLGQTDFDKGQDEIDRIQRRLSSNPEKYLTPYDAEDFEEDRSTNWERLKDRFGLRGKGEAQRLERDSEDRIQANLEQQVDESFDEYGLTQIVELIYDDTDIMTDGSLDSEATERVRSLVDEVGEEPFKEEARRRINRLADKIPDFDPGSDSVVNDEILERIEEATGRNYTSLDSALNALRDQLNNAEQNATQELLNRFEVAFGQRFEDVDEAVNQLRDQFTNLQNLDIETVEASFLGGDETPGVSLPAGFSELKSDVQQRAAEVIDLEATADVLPSRRRERPFADVRVREGTIERIDFGKAVNDPNIILREDADLAEATDPALTDADEQQDDVEIAVPEPEPTPDGDDEDDPEVELVDESGEIDDELTELAQTAIAAADDEDDAADAVIQLARVLDTAQATELAAGIDRNKIPQPLIDQLRDIFNRAGRDARSEARRETFGVNEIQRVLGLEEMEPDTGDDPEDIFDVPDDGFFDSDEDDDDTGDRRRDNGETQRGPGGNPRRERGSGRSANPGDDIADDVRDVVRDEIRDFAADASSGQGGDPNNLRSQPNNDRPDPDQRKADKRIQPLLGNSLAKAQKWIAAEGDRLALNPGDPPSPRQYWEQKGSNFYGNMLTRTEFINLTVDGVRK